MGRARALEEIRIMRFEEMLDRHERGSLTQAEAGEMLGMSERTFRRWQVRYREEGAAGLVDGRVGKPSPRRADAGELARARALYAEMYDGFTAKHFHEKLVEGHGYRLGYTVTRLALQASGQVKRAPRRGAHRRRRPRRPLPGMLLHQDAARHAWLAGRPALDLVVTLDDATSAVYSAILVEEESTASSFRALCEVVADKGLFCALYTDRGGHYFHTPVAGGGVDREHPTQVGRALAQLGIEHIAAYSPQARGRSERAFRTLEDRLPKELALAGIADVETANTWLRAVYLPAHNARFAVAAEEEGSAFVPVAPEQWREVLCRQETVRSATTTACAGTAACCRSRRARSVPTRPRQGAPARIPRRCDRALLGGPHRIADFPPPAADSHGLAA
jgi:transposase